jgi:hypothetical protein
VLPVRANGLMCRGEGKGADCKDVRDWQVLGSQPDATCAPIVCEQEGRRLHRGRVEFAAGC